MTPEEQMRRQLRFAFLLQVAGAVMFAIATVVRAVGIGFDVVTAVFALITVVIAGAAIFTRKKMQELTT
jgi:hypothetical protein